MGGINYVYVCLLIIEIEYGVFIFVRLKYYKRLYVVCCCLK